MPQNQEVCHSIGGNAACGIGGNVVQYLEICYSIEECAALLGNVLQCWGNVSQATYLGMCYSVEEICFRIEGMYVCCGHMIGGNVILGIAN